jgi:hypothetical protein
MPAYDYHYPEPICMMCGGDCDRDEVVWTGCNESPWERWGYCEACDVETFHPGVKIVKKKPIKVTYHAASVAQIQVRGEGPYDLAKVAEYFVAQGVPYALGELIAASPESGRMSNPDHRVVWYQDADTDGIYLNIEVTFKGAAQGFFYLGEATT